MQLTPSERDRLLLFTVAELARARQARGLLLNVPEATAIIADTVAEAARDGKRHDEALAAGQAVLGPADVLPGVADVLVLDAVLGIRTASIGISGGRIAACRSPRRTRSPVRGP